MRTFFWVAKSKSSAATKSPVLMLLFAGSELLAMLELVIELELILLDITVPVLVLVLVLSVEPPPLPQAVIKSDAVIRKSVGLNRVFIIKISYHLKAIRGACQGM